ncbi:hypothetical protein AVEN_62270-1 [Araneus ventricosus]|uniref:Uncharacterized protein n=1 Tax=Araneus ventricosus TaxID=182803 RepID=A0A4Y2EB44_ARAVE|nr:hypothetical protein AVEN_62270-1 [Araneus ventricosus]
MGLLHANPHVGVKRPPAGVGGSLERAAPAQLLSSSSDCGSKLRDPTQNRSRVASKRMLMYLNSVRMCGAAGTNVNKQRVRIIELETRLTKAAPTHPHLAQWPLRRNQRPRKKFAFTPAPDEQNQQSKKALLQFLSVRKDSERKNKLV